MKKLSFLLILASLLLTGCQQSSKESKDSIESKSEPTISESSEESVEESIESIESSEEPEESEESEESKEPEESEESVEESEPSEESTKESESEEDGRFTTNVTMYGRKKTYSVPVTYKDSFFDMDSDVYSVDLALFAYGASLATVNSLEASVFLKNLNFDNPYLSASYRVDPTEDSIAYFFGHRLVDGVNYVVVAVRGFDYGAEWANNCMVGKEGDHAGFKASAETVVASLDTYLASYKDQPTKVLFTGYSRGGAVANISADILFKREAKDKLIPDENFYFYTFESPRGLTEATAYSNVINVINSADLITYVVPEEYGLYRCGVDVDIHVDNVDELVKEFDDEIELPAFEVDEDSFTNEEGFIKYLLSQLINDENGSKTIKTREDYVDNAQPALAYFIKLIMCMKSETLNKAMADIKELGFDAYSIITEGDKFHDFIKPYLDEDEVVYDDDELLAYCTEVTTLVNDGPLMMLVAFALAYGDNLSRVVSMHYQEINYVLVKNYLVY